MSDFDGKLLQFEEHNYDWLIDKFIEKHSDDWYEFLHNEYMLTIQDPPEDDR